MYCSNSSKGEISVSYEFGFPGKSQVTHQTLLFVFSSCRWRQVKLHSTIVQSEILFWSEYKGCPSRLVSYSCMGYLWIIFWWNVDVSWMKNVVCYEKWYAVCTQFVCSLYAVLKLHTVLVKLHTLLSKPYVVLKLHINCIQTAYSFLQIFG